MKLKAKLPKDDANGVEEFNQELVGNLRNGKVVPAKLADLESRAGASDQNRTLWLAERNGGCTATQARDLILGKLKPRDLARDKLAGKIDDDLSHVPVIGWGKDREPVIADRLLGEDIKPESRVFHHPNNSRYLASPDGIGLTFDNELIVSEIKTANKDLAPGTKAYEASGYEWQMQWVMFVIGATSCRYVVEQRIDLPGGGFAPGEERRYTVERDEAKIAQLVAVVDAFLELMDRMAIDGEDPIDQELDTLGVNYLHHKDAATAAAKPQAEVFAEVKRILNGRDAHEFVQESLFARISWKRARTMVTTSVEKRPVVDAEAAQLASPKMWARLEKAAAAVERTEAAYRKAQEAAQKAAEAWATATAAHTTYTDVEVETVTDIKENLTITPIKPAKQEKKVSGR